MIGLKKTTAMLLVLILSVSICTIPASAYTYSSQQVTSINQTFNSHGWVQKENWWANKASLVKAIQSMLNDMGYGKLAVDGSFGPATTKAVKSYQKSKGLAQDGIVGRKTWDSLIANYKKFISSSKTQTKQQTSSSSKYNADAVISAAKKNTGKTGSQLGYNVAWCAYYVSDILRSNGVSIARAANPRDLVVNALNSGLGKYYSFRTKNTQNLKQNGLKRTDLVVDTSRNNVTPQKGDIIIYLWPEDTASYNWSHVGIAQSYSKGTIKTIEGNTSGGKVAERDRSYDSSVVGILRLS